MAPTASWTPAIAWEAFQYAAKWSGAGLDVELGAGAGRLGHDRVGGGRQPLDAVDVDRDVLAAGGEDLLAEQPVARVLGQAGSALR